MSPATQPDDAILRMRQSDAWQRRTIWQQLQRISADFGEKEALTTVNSDGLESRITYAQLLARSDSLAAGLFRIGVRRGDRVALWMTNSIEWACTYLATLRIGAVLVPLNTWLKTGEAAYMLRHSRPRHLIMLDRFRTQDYIGMFSQICPDWAHASPGRLFSEELPELRTVVVLRRSGVAPSNAHDWRAIERDGAARREEQGYAATTAEVTPQDLAIIIYTSGSTGHPKGVMLEQWGFVTSVLLRAERLKFGAEARLFCAMPFFHNSGSVSGLWYMLFVGGTLVFTEAHDAQLEIRLMERERCDCQWNIPSICRDQLVVLKREDKRLRLRWMLAVGAESIQEVYERFGARMQVNIYGLSEGYSGLTLVSPDDPQDKRDETCGKPLPGVEIRVVDPATGGDVEPGEIGEAWVRGHVMRGYFDQPDLTRRSIDPDGWLHTEDLVERDADGYYRFVGRLKAMLKVGGENVAAEEVENYLRGLPGVVDCCVVGVPDKQKDEVPLAYVSTRPDTKLTSDEIIAGCAKGLAMFKIPRYVEFLESIPLLANGKLDRKAMSEKADKEFGSTSRMN